MGLLAFCWLIVEIHVIPNGLFMKWFYLSFYIHPFFLFFCQIYLWMKKLHKWLLLLYFLPFRIARCLIFFIFRSLKKITIVLLSSSDNEVFYEAMEPEDDDLEMMINSTHDQISIPYRRCIIIPRTDARYLQLDRSLSQSRVVLFEMGNKSKVINSFSSTTFEAAGETYADADHKRTSSSWLNEYLYSDHYTNSLNTYYEPETADYTFYTSPQATYPQLHEHTGQFVSSSTSPSIINQDVLNHHELEEDLENMSFPDHMPLNDDDDDIINKIVLTAPSFSDDINNFLSSIDHEYSAEQVIAIDGALKQRSTSRRVVQLDNTPVDEFYCKYTERMRFYDVLYHERLYGMRAILSEHSTVPILLMSNHQSLVSRQGLLKSLECDFELTYVAQLCLSWEALHYQYWKVNNSRSSSIHPSVSDKFQEFNILLQKFIEDEQASSKGQRYSDYLHTRISFQSQLQVPDVTAYVMKEDDNCMGREAMIITKCQVLDTIEKCINALFLYIKADYKRTSTLTKKHHVSFSSTSPTVEDPRDLELLYQVTKSLRKKKLLLKHSQARRKCWLRRQVKPKDDETELIFVMVDIKLVERLLKMPIVSSSHLKWCQEKLNNLEIRDGKSFKACTNSGLFPSS